MKLIDKFPELEYYYSSLNKENFSYHEYQSQEKLWWKYCERNHVCYKTALEFKRFNNCPSCKEIDNSVFLPEDRLDYLYPSIAKHFSLLNKKSADAVLPDSNYKALWNDLEEKQSVYDRVRSAIKNGEVERRHIPVKRLRKERIEQQESIKKSKNDDIENKIKTTFSKNFIPLSESDPDIARFCLEDASLISRGSNRVVKWTCAKGHFYTSKVKDTVKRKDKCVICSGIKISPGVNDIKTLYPHIAEQITYPNPSTITPHYSGRIYMKCIVCEYEWNFLNSYEKYVNDAVNCPACTNKILVEGVNDLLSVIPIVQEFWHEKNSFQPNEISKSSNERIYLYCSNNKEHVIETMPSGIYKNQDRTSFICRRCSSSSGEKEVQYFIESLGFKVESNKRNIIPPLELDVYVPEINFAIEFNGIYWHSEKFKDKDYHFKKMKMCQEKGITLFQIWDDDWNEKKDIIKKMIRHKLRVSKEHTVYARNAYFSSLNSTEAKIFLDENHIQGYSQVSKNFCLKDSEDKIVAVISASLHKRELFIDRYATSLNVPGGFTKLLSHTLLYYKNGFDKVSTFSDNMISEGDLYKKNGFYLDKIINPDYQYVYLMKRHHKFNFRKKRFKEDEKLQYRPGLTEKELVALNGIGVIWDAGKIKWSLDVDVQDS